MHIHKCVFMYRIITTIIKGVLRKLCLFYKNIFMYEEVEAEIVQSFQNMLRNMPALGPRLRFLFSTKIEANM